MGVRHGRARLKRTIGRKQTILKASLWICLSDSSHILLLNDIIHFQDHLALRIIPEATNDTH